MPKISQLTALTVPDSGDELPIVDVSASTTKKITREDLLAGAPLPADTVDTQAIYDGAVTAPKIAAGMIVQQVVTTSSTYASTTALIPYDNTIPQNTEGTEFMNATITPTSATSIIVAKMEPFMGTSGANQLIGALFKDSEANAFATNTARQTGTPGPVYLTVVGKFIAGATSPITVKFRAGLQAAGTSYINGVAGSLFGTSGASVLTLTEIKA